MNNNGLFGFLFFSLLVIWAASSWGDPDVIDALIYYLSDGSAKNSENATENEGLKESIRSFTIPPVDLIFSHYYYYYYVLYLSDGRTAKSASRNSFYNGK